MNIIKQTNPINTSSKNNRKIEYIVLHYTAGVTSKAGTAANTAKWFSNPAAKASADFIVDDATIVQYNPDIENRFTWAVGGKKYSSMTTSLGGQFYGKCVNNNSISIEMCSNKQNRSTLSASDTDWYFTDATILNAVALTKYLMDKYHIDIDHVIMHHQVTGKVCPNPWVLNEDRLKGWYNFKKQLQGKEEEEMTQEQFNKMFLVAMENYRKSLQDNEAGKWSKESRDWAVSTGLIKGSDPLPDGQPNYMWEDFLTREQMATLLYRFKNMK